MKKQVVSNSLLFLYFIFIMGTLFSCTKMDQYYKDYVKPRTYVGMVDSAWTYPGDHKIKLLWINPNDKSALKAKIYWNDFLDSTLINLTSGVDTQSIVIKNLEEKDYTFNIVTVDQNGNTSLPLEVGAHAYGKNYKNSLSNRLVSNSALAEKYAKILWGTPRPGSFGTKVTYTDTSNVEKNIFIQSTKDTTIFAGLDTTKNILIQTAYLPDSSAIDTFYADPDKVYLPDKQSHSLHLTSNGTAADAEFIDFYWGKKYYYSEIPQPKGYTIDIYHLLGSGSKQNLATVDSRRIIYWSSSVATQIDNWTYGYSGIFISLGGDSTAQSIYNNMKEYNRTDFINTYNSVAPNYVATNVVTLLSTGDILLFHNYDTGLYAAIKVDFSDPSVYMDIEFKVSRPPL